MFDTSHLFTGVAPPPRSAQIPIPGCVPKSLHAEYVGIATAIQAREPGWTAERVQGAAVRELEERVGR